MAFGIPGITAPSQPAAAPGEPISQLVPQSPSSAPFPSMAPDTVKRSDASSRGSYNADLLQRASVGAQMLASRSAAVTIGAAERLGPTLGNFDAKVGRAAVGVIRAVAPIAGETLGAAGLILLTPTPAGESNGDLAKTRVIDAAGHQRMISMAYADAMRPQGTTIPGQPVNFGDNHTIHPAHSRDAARSVLTTPAETQKWAVHTGHAVLDVREITKPTGTAIYQPKAADQATLARPENVVGPEYAAHLTPIGTLVNADKAVIDVKRKIEGYALNPEHDVGKHKARVFKSTLGYDRGNSQDVVNQIRKGVQSQPAIPGKTTTFGTQFGVDIPVTGPGGSATVRTGWNYDPGSDVPRLTTAVVKK